MKDWSDARINSDQYVARIQVTFIGTLQRTKVAYRKVVRVKVPDRKVDGKKESDGKESCT